VELAGELVDGRGLGVSLRRHAEDDDPSPLPAREPPGPSSPLALPSGAMETATEAAPSLEHDRLVSHEGD
jgi:hypothetical protein